MKELIKKLLQNLIEDIDVGNSNLSEQECLSIFELLNKISRQDIPMSKYQAYTYLGISRATFDNMVKNDKLPKGQKIAGFKELFWYKKDLNKYITK